MENKEAGLPSVEEIIAKYTTNKPVLIGEEDFYYKTILDHKAALKYLAELVRDETLRIAAEKAKTKDVIVYDPNPKKNLIGGYSQRFETVVDKDSILDLKDDPRLQIK